MYMLEPSKEQVRNQAIINHIIKSTCNLAAKIMRRDHKRVPDF